MPRAIKATEANLEDIVIYGKSRYFDLTHVKYDMEDAATYGQDLYVITDGNLVQDNVTFITMWKSDFDNLWKFKDVEYNFAFADIVRR